MESWKWSNFLCIVLILHLRMINYEVDAITLLDEYILDSGAVESHCNKAITGKQSVILLSQPGAGLFGGLTSYSADQNCNVTYEVEDGTKILIQFPFFDLHESNVSCTDKIQITELGDGSTDVTDICAAETVQEFVSVTDKIEFRFISDSTTQRKGFKALLTSFYDGNCTDTEFQCDTNRCISSDLKCDGNNHCVDKSDESKEQAGCSLGDEILNKITGLGKYGMLALAGAIAVLFLTIFGSVFLYKCVKADGKCCQCSEGKDVEAVNSFSPPPNTSKQSKQDTKTEKKTNAKKGKKVIKVQAKDDPDMW